MVILGFSFVTMIYLCRWTRQDLDGGGFLSIRVKRPDKDDYKKLTRVMQFLQGTKDFTLIIEPDIHPNWWVDSLYAVHPDMRSLSGIYMTLGKVTTDSRSYKQNPIPRVQQRYNW